MSARDSDHPVGALQRFLHARRLDSPHIAGLVVALSAGPDSLTLLLAAAMTADTAGLRLRAVHVHHGLHADADAWAAQAMAQAEAVGVPCQVLRVRVAAQASVEEAARRARYDALVMALEPDEALLLAHHQDDQAETLLLRLMRGAGLNGLTGMQPISSWQAGGASERVRWRPWLGLPRDTLARWLPRAVACLSQHHPGLDTASLQPVQDPANADLRFDRTLLRQSVLPLLRQRWPEAPAQLARSAMQLAAQAQALDALADDWLARATRPDGALSLAPLASRDDAALQAVVARWLSAQGAPPLPWRYWPRLRSELLQAREDAQPRLEWSGWSLRRYRDALFVCPPSPSGSQPPESLSWPDPSRSLQVDGRGWRLEGLPEPALAQCWCLRRRRDGDRWRPAGRRLQSLKAWCQQQGIPPWLRDRLWLLCRDDEIVAVLCGEQVVSGAGLAPAQLQQVQP